MGISLVEIFKKLETNNTDFIIFGKTPAEINDVVLFKKDTNNFKNSILYLIKASDVLKYLQHKFPDNLLCLLDVPVNAKKIFPETSNIILIKEKADIIQLYNIIEKQITCHNRIMQSCTRLLELSTKGNGIQYIANNCHDIFGKPVIITDKTFKLIAYTRFETNEPLWNEITKNKHGSSEIIRKIKEASYLKKPNKTDLYISTSIENPEYQWIMTSIISHGNVEGYILMPDYLNSFEDIDEELVLILAKIIASEFEKEIHNTLTKEKIFEYFIQDLIDGKITNEIVIQEKINYINLNFKKYLYLMKIVFKHNDNNDEDNIWYIKDTLESLINIRDSFIYRDCILFLINRDHMSGLNNEETKSLSSFLNKNRMIGGISRHFFNISSIKDCYEQCTKAIKLGSCLNENESFFKYDDYSIFHIIETLNTKTNIMSICHPALMELLEFDEINRTGYCKTLFVYLSNNSNLTKSAKELCIHRNSMEYRIHKIEEILKMNIHDSNNSLVLYLSLNIIKYNSTFGSSSFKFNL